MKVGIALILVLACCAAFADTVELNDGTKIKCTVVLEDEEIVFIKTNGETKSINKSTIHKITRESKETKKEETPEPAPAVKTGDDEKLSLPSNDPKPADNPGKEEKGNPGEDNLEEEKPPRPVRQNNGGNGELNKLFEILRETCKVLPSSGTDEERTFYRMRAIILQRHINSHGLEAGKIALAELTRIRRSQWKDYEIHIGFLSEMVAGCRDRDIVPYFWEIWLPPMLQKIQRGENRTIHIKVIRKIASEMQTTYSNTYKNHQYILKSHDERGKELYTVKKKPLRMPK